MKLFDHIIRLFPVYLIVQVVFIIARNPALEGVENVGLYSSVGAILMTIGLYPYWVVVQKYAKKGFVTVGGFLAYVLVMVFCPLMVIVGAYILRALIWGLVA